MSPYWKLVTTTKRTPELTCVTVWQTSSDCCSRYRYLCLADLCLPQKPSIWEVVHEDREKQIPGYRWHLQDLWRGDLWRVVWLSQCYRVWHYSISIQGWKSETTQENDNSRQVQPLGATRKTETLPAKCWEHAELHSNHHVTWKTRWRFCGDNNPHVRTAEKQVQPHSTTRQTQYRRAR